MTEPTFTLTVTNVEVLPTLGELANVATKIAYQWTAARDDEPTLNWPGVIELGPADPEYFTDLSTLTAEDFQDVVGGWVQLELGRERIRNTKVNMAMAMASALTATVPFDLPEA